MKRLLFILKNLFLSFIDVWKDIEFRILFVLILLLLLTGTIFYSEFEDHSIVDSLFFSVMIMSTIGYENITLMTTGAKIFTIVFAFISIGVFIALGSKVAFVFVDRSKKSQKVIKDWEMQRHEHKKRRKKLRKEGEN
ncbi:MAG: two pore domain potassium channel family protein [Ignavibacteria bacterium]|nr:two pore domain potassium channel family protein [Ignavibacteria bacterium]